MARPLKEQERLTKILKVRLSENQDDVLTYLADLNHISKADFLRKIIKDATKAGSTTRVTNQLTKPVLAQRKLLLYLWNIKDSLWRLSLKAKEEPYSQELEEEIIQAKEEIREIIYTLKERWNIETL